MLKRNKFSNKKIISEGIKFDSKLEFSVFLYLKNLEREGSIKNLRTQEKVYLTDAKILYKADFMAFCCKSGDPIYYESKGTRTATWMIKKRLWKHYGPARLIIFTGSYKKFSASEEVIPLKLLKK